MKLDNPAAAFYIFTDQLKLTPQGLWCVALDQNSHFLSLVEPLSDDWNDVAFWIHQLKNYSLTHNNDQLLFVRVSRHHIFDSDDWLWISKIFKKETAFIVCDYLKISESGFSSLMDYSWDKDEFVRGY